MTQEFASESSGASSPLTLNYLAVLNAYNKLFAFIMQEVSACDLSDWMEHGAAYKSRCIRFDQILHYDTTLGGRLPWLGVLNAEDVQSCGLDDAELLIVISKLFAASAVFNAECSFMVLLKYVGVHIM